MPFTEARRKPTAHRGIGNGPHALRSDRPDPFGPERRRANPGPGIGGNQPTDPFRRMHAQPEARDSPERDAADVGTPHTHGIEHGQYVPPQLIERRLAGSSFRTSVPSRVVSNDAERATETLDLLIPQPRGRSNRVRQQKSRCPLRPVHPIRQPATLNEDFSHDNLADRSGRTIN